MTTAQEAEPLEGVSGHARAASDRVPRLLLGLATALVPAALWGLAALGRWPLASAVLVVQLLLVLGTLAVVDAPASGGIFLIAAAASVAADGMVLSDHGRVGGLAGVLAVALVAGFLHQLLREPRPRVTESLADLLLVTALSCTSACVIAALEVHGGRTPALGALAGAAACLAAGRLGDLLVRWPALAVGATRAWPGFLLGLGVGVVVTALITTDDLSTTRGALLGLTVAAAAAAADLAADLARVEIEEAEEPSPAARRRRVSALAPTSALLPVAVIGPVLLLAVRLVLR